VLDILENSSIHGLKITISGASVIDTVVKRALGYAGFRHWFRTVRRARDMSRLKRQRAVVRGKAHG